MLILYLNLVKTTRRFVKFQGEQYNDGIVYLPRAVWEVMGRPTHIAVEVSPAEMVE